MTTRHTFCYKLTNMGDFHPPSQKRRPYQRGFTLVETVATMAVIAILGASLMVGLLAAHRHVAMARAITASRIILQRNIDRAMGVPFFSNMTRPEVLAQTSNKTLYSHEGVGTQTTLPILTSNDGTVLLSGTLYRTVVNEPIPSELSDVAGTRLLRITFDLHYHYLRRNHVQSLSTIRSQDDQ